MPVHDWTRVDDGTFHAFHTVWIGKLMEALNQGVLPPGYYAMAEQVAAVPERREMDVLTLQAPEPPQSFPEGGLTVAAAPPKVRWRARPERKPRPGKEARRRRVAVRHVSGHRLVAVVEVVSPSNLGRKDHVEELVEKVVHLLEREINVLLIDLLPPTRPARSGMHGAVWARFERTRYEPPASEPLTLASYRWDGDRPEAFVEPVAVGRPLIPMPLFLSSERYVNVPLEATYQSAFEAMPPYWRDVLSRPAESNGAGS